MPIDYCLVQRGTPGKPDGPRKWYATARARGATTERRLAERISQSSTFSTVDMKGAIEALLQEIPRELAEGQIVQLGDLGSFRLTLQSNGTDTPEQFTAANITKIKVNFVPSREFEKLIAGAVLHRVEASTPAPLSHKAAPRPSQ